MNITRYLLGHELLCAERLYGLHLENDSITAVSIGLAVRGETIACPLPQLLHQPGERLCCVRLCYVCCYSCCSSQERINMSAVSMAPHIFFKPLSSHLAYHEFSEQCTHSVNSETVGTMNRISNTGGMPAGGSLSCYRRAWVFFGYSTWRSATVKNPKYHFCLSNEINGGRRDELNPFYGGQLEENMGPLIGVWRVRGDQEWRAIG